MLEIGPHCQHFSQHLRLASSYLKYSKTDHFSKVDSQERKLEDSTPIAAQFLFQIQIPKSFNLTLAISVVIANINIHGIISSMLRTCYVSSPLILITTSLDQFCYCPCSAGEKTKAKEREYLSHKYRW